MHNYLSKKNRLISFFAFGFYFQQALCFGSVGATNSHLIRLNTGFKRNKKKTKKQKTDIRTGTKHNQIIRVLTDIETQ